MAYWLSDRKRHAWTILAFVVIAEIMTTVMTVRISYWNQHFFNALELKDKAEVINQIWMGSLVLTGFVIAIMARVVAMYRLKIGWREWLTRTVVADYLKNKTYHQLNLNASGIDNPDQRIAIDIKNFTDSTPDLALGLFSAVSRTGAFVAVLWSISPSLTLGSTEIEGYLVYVAVIYAVLATLITHLLGRKLIPVFNRRERVEADFRYAAIRLRENSEAIALSDGEAREERELRSLFDQIRKNWFDVLKYTKRVLGFNAMGMQLSQMIPTFAALPAFLSGNMTLGVLMQTRAAFFSVELGFSWIQTSYTEIAQWKASVDRLMVLKRGIEQAQKEKAQNQIESVVRSSENVSLEDIRLSLPDGTELLAVDDFQFRAGENVLLSGPSGSGKTTMFRAMSGLWTWGRGKVSLTADDTMFIPQSMYVPIGSLKGALTYPDSPDSYSDADVQRLMRLCHLQGHEADLHREDDWGRILSGGEKQRAAFVRAMLKRPTWLFMDESTSALDPVLEATVMNALVTELPDTTLITIAHRESLKKWHPRWIEIKDGGMNEMLPA